MKKTPLLIAGALVAHFGLSAATADSRYDNLGKTLNDLESTADNTPPQLSADRAQAKAMSTPYATSTVTETLVDRDSSLVEYSESSNTGLFSTNLERVYESEDQVCISEASENVFFGVSVRVNEPQVVRCWDLG